MFLARFYSPALAFQLFRRFFTRTASSLKDHARVHAFLEREGGREGGREAERDKERASQLNSEFPSKCFLTKFRSAQNSAERRQANGPRESLNDSATHARHFEFLLASASLD